MPLALPAIGENGEAKKYPSMPCVTSERIPHGICVEKHLQLPVGEAAMFQDLGNSPASFEAPRWADFLGCHDGWDVQMADAVQAYFQATLRGAPCWIELPPEAVPSECNWVKYRRPVVPLREALYGHPDAGTFWAAL